MASSSSLPLLDIDSDFGISGKLRPFERVVRKFAVTEWSHLVLANLVAEYPANIFHMDQLFIWLHAHKALRRDQAVFARADVR